MTADMTSRLQALSSSTPHPSLKIAASFVRKIAENNGRDSVDVMSKCLGHLAKLPAEVREQLVAAVEALQALPAPVAEPTA